MDISIIVCTYDRATSLRRTLGALDRQLVPPDVDWELLVIDNNSSDATAAVVEAFAAATPIRVRYLFVARQGLSHARNVGIANNQAAIVGFTDDDVCPEPDWVARIAVGMRETRADILGGCILPAWECPPPPWLANRVSLRGALALMESQQFSLVVNPTQFPTVWGANMAFRREVFCAVGLFDIRRGMMGSKLYRGEEIDLVTRALAVGCRVVFDPRVRVWHRIATDRMRFGYFSRLYFQRSEGNALTQEPARGRQLLGSLWYTVLRFASWIAAVARRRSNSLDRWLECCATAGFLWGLLKLYFRSVLQSVRDGHRTIDVR